MSAKESSTACTLRVIQVTDVYTLDNFPSLKNLIIEKRKELDEVRGGNGQAGSKTISVLSGDFLMPYLLSTIDKGKGMMKMLNQTPIDYLTWGNHENDLGHKYLMQREKEYKGVWINTNMQSHESFENSECQTDAAEVDITSKDGSNTRKVGMIGILSDQKSLYQSGCFNGATIEDPFESMKKYKTIMEEERHCDMVLPLCHLYEPQDEKTCREFDFPVIMSGHDHHVVDKVVEGTRLLKPGSDAIKAVILDITWEDAASKKPLIEVEIVEVANWEPDGALQKEVEKCNSKMKHLQNTELTIVPEKFRPLSSLGAREKRVTCGTYLCSSIRDALNMNASPDSPNCDCVVIKGGSVPRGGKDYPDDSRITLEFLKSETTETQEISICELPGSVLRIGLRETWEAANPGWMQYCDGIEVDDQGYVISVGGKDLDPDRLYKVGSAKDFYRVRDGPSIGKYFEEHPEHKPDEDSGCPTHALLMNYWAEVIWHSLFDHMDSTGSGKLSLKELKVLDKDGDGKIDAEEIRRGLHEICGFATHPDETAMINMILDIAGGEEGEDEVTLNAINEKRKEVEVKRLEELAEIIPTN